MPGARLPRQLRCDPEHTATERGYRETVATLHLELPDGGEYSLDVRSRDDIVQFVNDILARPATRAGSTRSRPMATGTRTSRCPGSARSASRGYFA